MATYDPKRSRPAVLVEPDAPAPVEQLVELPEIAPEIAPDDVQPEVGLPEAVVNVEVSPSPFEPAGPPDQRLGKAIAIGVASAGALALMFAWRRRRT